MLKAITVVNLQSIKFAQIELPKTGIIRFLGPNSNGKSIITKATTAVISCTLNNTRVRRPLINRDAQAGSITYEKWDTGEMLHVNIARESSQTYYEYRKPGQQPIRRYLLDKDLWLLVEQFGFHYNKKRDLSLNVYNTHDPLIMINTSGALNYDLVNSSISDAKAEAALASMMETITELKGKYKELSTATENVSARLATLPFYDIDKETDLALRLRVYKEVIAYLGVPKLPKIQKPLDMTFFELFEVEECVEALKLLDDVNLRELTRCQVIELLAVPEIDDDVIASRRRYDEMVLAVEEGRCPVCGSETGGVIDG